MLLFKIAKPINEERIQGGQPAELGVWFENMLNKLLK